METRSNHGAYWNKRRPLPQPGDPKAASLTGLEMLEQLTAAGPEVPENHLRLAEAYVTLHDPEPSIPHLCFSLAHQDALRADDQALLKWLISDVGPLDCPPSPDAARPAARGTGSTAPPAKR